MIDTHKMQLTGRLANYPRRPIVDLNEIVRRSRSDPLRSGTHITTPPSTADASRPPPRQTRPARSCPAGEETVPRSALRINLSANRIRQYPGSVLNDHLYSLPVWVRRRGTRLSINSNPSESAIAETRNYVLRLLYNRLNR